MRRQSSPMFVSSFLSSGGPQHRDDGGVDAFVVVHLRRELGLPGGKKTRPDGYEVGWFEKPAPDDLDIVDAKFMDGGLTPNQQEAMRLLGPRYRLDKFLPRDVGVAVGLPAANLTSTEVRDITDRATRRKEVSYWW